MRRFTAALSFFNLANTDSEGMLEEAEVILTASAFEQLLDGHSARALCLDMAPIARPFFRCAFLSNLAARPRCGCGNAFARGRSIVRAQYVRGR